MQKHFDDVVLHGAAAGFTVAFLEDFVSRLFTGVMIAVISGIAAHFVRKILDHPQRRHHKK